jgi:hypothetical protein
MSEILNRFSLQAVKLNWQLVLTACVLWLIVVGCAVSSIRAQPFEKRQRVFWIAIVVCLPILGLLAYLPFSFNKEELPHIFLPKKSRKDRASGKTSSRPSAGGKREQ